MRSAEMESQDTCCFKAILEFTPLEAKELVQTNSNSFERTLLGFLKIYWKSQFSNALLGKIVIEVLCFCNIFLKPMKSVHSVCI